METVKTIIFFVSLVLTVYFYGKLFSWGVHEISKKGFNKVTSKQTGYASICMFLACIGWTILYYLSL